VLKVNCGVTKAGGINETSAYRRLRPCGSDGLCNMVLGTDVGQATVYTIGRTLTCGLALPAPTPVQKRQEFAPRCSLS